MNSSRSKRSHMSYFESALWLIASPVIFCPNPWVLSLNLDRERRGAPSGARSRNIIDRARVWHEEMRRSLPPEMTRPTLGSGLVDQSQKMMVAASAMAEKKTCGHRS